MISKDNFRENTSDFSMSWSFWDQLILESLHDSQIEPQPQVHHQEQSTSYHATDDPYSYGNNGNYRESALSDHFDKMVERMEGPSQSSGSQSSGFDSSRSKREYSKEEYYEQQYKSVNYTLEKCMKKYDYTPTIIVYCACKKVKEYFFGKSKKTLEHERKCKLFEDAFQERKNQKNQGSRGSEELSKAKKLEEVQHKHELQNSAGTQSSKVNLEAIQLFQQQNNISISKHNNQDDSPFQRVMENRSKVLQESVDDQSLVMKQFQLNSQTVGFLHNQGVDIGLFQKLEGLPIQHQLTYELVDVLDTLADYGLQYHYEVYQIHLVDYCVHLASLTQQSNLEAALEQAIQGTNCCQGISHYLQGMVSGVGDAYQQFNTALDYFDTVCDSYRSLIIRDGLQGAAMAYGLEVIVTAGMVGAPTITAAATACMIGVITWTMAPICMQSMINTLSFGGACITCNWNKVGKDLDDFCTFLSSPDTLSKTAAFVGGGIVKTPNLSNLVEQLLSLRPVITSIQYASGEMVQSFRLMTKNRISQVYAQTVELLQLPEFINFNLLWEQVLGCHFFDILPKNHPALVAAFEGVEGGLIISGENSGITQLFMQTKNSAAGEIVKTGVTQVADSIYQVSQETLSKNFAKTETGKKVIEAIKKEYEELMFVKVAIQYDKLTNNQALPEIIDLFNTCQELSIVPQYITDDIQQLHTLFKDKYLGLEEFSGKNKYLTMQMRHIFYPSLQVKLDVTNQIIKDIHLNGFHHDELEALEKSGLCKFINRVEGKDCFMADVDFGDGIICKGKTFFSPSWSREKTAQVIFEASQDRLKMLDEEGSGTSIKRLYECKSLDGLIINILINFQNVIISAYPSENNF